MPEENVPRNDTGSPELRLTSPVRKLRKGRVTTYSGLMATAQETYAMLEKESLWATATRCHQALAARAIPHAIIGGVAVCLHGYQRNTL